MDGTDAAVQIRQSVRFGVAGLGGYAQSIADTLLDAQSKLGPDVVRFVATCDPNLAGFADRVALLKKSGVDALASFDALLSQPIDAVWLPVPIHLHRPFTEQAFAAGKPVMCEKPPAGCVEDLDAMARASRAAGLPLLFGYQDIYDPSVLTLKRKLLAGAIGEVRSLSIAACWPRDSVYYGRNDWAGKFKRNGHWVMDSIITNALAHPVNMCLFLLGATEAAAASPESIEGELYRVNPIENFDTVSLRATLDTGATFVVSMTHACREQWGPEIRIVGSRGSATILDGQVTLSPAEGPADKFSRSKSSRLDMVRLACAHIRGAPASTLDGALATPETARPHLVLCNALSETVPVRTVAEAFVESTPTKSKAAAGTLRSIRDIEPLIRRSATELKLLSELGAEWASPPTATKRSLAAYATFAGPANG